MRKSKGIDLKPYKHLIELNALAEEMAHAMRCADIGYVAKRGRVTPRMLDIWCRYVESARKYA